MHKDECGCRIISMDGELIEGTVIDNRCEFHRLLRKEKVHSVSEIERRGIPPGVPVTWRSVSGRRHRP